MSGGIITVSQGTPRADPTQAWSAEVWDAVGRITLALATNGAGKVMESGGRTIVGEYSVGLSSVNSILVGDAPTTMLAALANPTQSTRNMFVKRVAISVIKNAANASPARNIEVSLRRNAGGAISLPTTAGTLNCMAGGRLLSTAPASQGVVYMHSSAANPFKATPAAGRMGTGFVPYLFTQVGEEVPLRDIPLHESRRDIDDIVLLPGEALLVMMNVGFAPALSAGAADVGFMPDFQWTEGSDNS